MASTFSPNLRIELIGAGEQAGAWNNTTNNNLGTLIEQAICGVQEITLAGSDYILEFADGAEDESRNMILILRGTPGGSRNVIAPDVDKVYIVRNQTANSHTIKTASGSGVSVPADSSAIVFCDKDAGGGNGTFYNAVEDLAADATIGGVPIVTTTGSQTISDKTLTAPKFADNGFIADPSGNQILAFGVTASAVNEVKVTNAATGAGPTIASDGGDANIDLLLVAKGTGVVKADGLEVATVSGAQSLSDKTLTAPKFVDGGFIADANGNELIVMDTVSSSVNELKVANAATGNSPSIAAQGDDTNVSISLSAKGTGTVRFDSVASFGAGTVSAPSIAATGDLNTGIWFPSSDTISFTTNGTEDFRIGSDGQLGIGGANYGTSGQVLTSGGPSAAPTWTTPSALVQRTAIATTSGTTQQFTSIPSTVNRITVSFFNIVSADWFGIQLGTSSGYATSGYSAGSFSQGGESSFTDGFYIRFAGGGTSGIMTITRIDSTRWVSSHATDNGAVAGGGSIQLSGQLDRLRLISASAFTSGFFNIMYE